MAFRAGKARVFAVERESGIGLVIERHVAKTGRRRVAPGAVDAIERAELSEMRILMTGLAIAASGPSERAALFIGTGRR